MQDGYGAEELEMELQGQSVLPGQRVRLEGIATIARRGGGVRIGAKGSVVDNNGIHGMTEKSGAVYLKAGRIKCELALARAKKLHDKREAERARATEAEARAAVRRHSR